MEHRVCRAETEVHYQGAVGRVIGMMRERLDDELNLQDMADVAYMSPFHLNRVFRRITGVPPGRFLTAVRLERAKRLLATTDGSVTDISFEVGYNSLGTFSRRFAELVGVSPSELRSLAARGPDSSWPGLCPSSADRAPAAGGIDGRVDAAPGFSGLIFVGAFASPIPQGRPLACALLGAPGRFQLAALPDGDYSLVAAGLERGSEPMGHLLYERAFRGASSAPLRIRRGRAPQPVRIELHPPQPFDPPILMTFPALLRQRPAFRWTEAPAAAAAAGSVL